MTNTMEPVPVPLEMLIFGAVLYGALLVPMFVACVICMAAAVKQQLWLDKQLKQKDGAS